MFLQRETGRGENACNTVGFGGINTNAYPTSARPIIGRVYAPITVVWYFLYKRKVMRHATVPNYIINTWQALREISAARRGVIPPYPWKEGRNTGVMLIHEGMVLSIRESHCERSVIIQTYGQSCLKVEVFWKDTLAENSISIGYAFVDIR